MKFEVDLDAVAEEMQTINSTFETGASAMVAGIAQTNPAQAQYAQGELRIASTAAQIFTSLMLGSIMKQAPKEA